MLEELNGPHPVVRAPYTQVVLLTMDNSQPFAQAALDAGALGFVLKDRADSDLLPAIRAAARGEPYTSPSVMQSRGGELPGE